MFPLAGDPVVVTPLELLEFCLKNVRSSVIDVIAPPEVVTTAIGTVVALNPEVFEVECNSPCRRGKRNSSCVVRHRERAASVSKNR